MRFLSMIVLLFCLWFTHPIFSAGLHIYSFHPTTVTVFFDNGVIEQKIFRGPGWKDVNALFAGFSKIKWTDRYGKEYEKELKIIGLEMWRPVVINGPNIKIGSMEPAGFIDVVPELP